MKKLLFALSAVVLLASCSKDDEPVTPTMQNLSGSYKLQAATFAGIDVLNNSDPNLNEFDACEKDDVSQLNSDGSYVYTDAGTQCNPVGNDSGTWSLTNSSTIVLDGQQLNIKSFNGSTLVLSDNSSGFGEFVITMKKQ